MATPNENGLCAMVFWSTPPEHSRLSDQDWLRVEHLFSRGNIRRGRPRRSEREILNAILWVEANENKWHRLPSGYPPAQTCYAKYVAWRREGLLDQVRQLLGCASGETANCA